MIKLMRVAVAILYFTFSSILITFARKEISFWYCPQSLFSAQENFNISITINANWPMGSAVYLNNDLLTGF